MHLLRYSLILAFVVVTTQVASADAILRLTSGGDTVSITDGGAGDLDGTAGVIVFSGSVGSFSINVTTGLTKPAIGGVNDPRLDLVSVNVSGSAGTLLIEFTDTDFGPAPFPGFQTNVGGTTQGSVEVFSYYDLGNAEFGKTSTLADLGPFTSGAFAASAGIGVGPLPGPYSLTLVASVTHTSAGQASSFNAELNPNPEPSTVVLLGVAAVGLAALRRRRRAA